MATIFQTISTLSGIVTDAITAGADTNVPAKLVRNTLVKVSTGKYYEVLPIIVPAECCIIGDELRSTNVQARTSTNSSLTPAKDFTYSYQALDRVKSVVDDIVTGVAVTPTTGNTLTQDQTWPYAETSVVGPAVERKSGLSAYSTLSINATKWFSAEWAQQKGIYSEVYESNDVMDEAINKLAHELVNSNPEATKKLKEVFWENANNWDELLKERAEYSGQLVLSEFTKQAIARFKKK